MTTAPPLSASAANAPTKQRGICCFHHTGSIVLLALALTLAIIITAIGAALPAIIGKVIKDTLKDRAPINQDEWTDAQWRQFTNTTRSSSYFIYNLTNLPEVLAGTQKANFAVVGPLQFTRHYIKTGLEYSSDATELSYWETRAYEPIGNTNALLDQVVTVPNTVFLGAMAQVARSIAAAGLAAQNISLPYGVAPGQARLNEQLMYAGVTSSSVMPLLTSQLTNTSSTLVSALKILSVATYVRATYSLAAAQSITPTQVTTLWATADATAPMSFRLPVPIIAGTPAEIAAISRFIDPTSTSTLPYSFLTPTGNQAWLGLVSARCVGPLLATLSAANGLSTNQTQVICAWMGGVSVTAGFETVVMGAAGQIVMGVLNNTAYVPTNFPELALLQYGSGLVVPLTSNNTFQSVVDIMGASAGLLASVNIPKAPEFAVGARDACVKLRLLNATVPLPQCANQATWNARPLTINQTRVFLTKLNGAAGLQAIGALYQLLPAVFANPLAPPALALAAIKANPAYSQYLDLLNSEFIYTDGSNAGQIYAYLHDYIGHMFTGYPGGFESPEAGLFIKSTLRQALFPSTRLSAQGVPYHAITLSRTIQPGNVDEAVRENEWRMVNRKTRVFTGRDDVSKVGTLIAYEGTEQLTSQCLADHYQNDYPIFGPTPNGVGPCSNPTGRASYDWLLMSPPHVIRGSGDGMRWGPEMERDSLASYSNEFERVVHFNYSGEDVEVKGITLRRYKIDKRHFYANITDVNGFQWTAANNPLKNAYFNSTAGNNSVTAPDGIFHAFSVFGGIPLSISQAQFTGVDPAVANRITIDPQNNVLKPGEADNNVDVEFHSGNTMQGQTILQGNFRLTRGEFNFGFYDGLFQGAGADVVYVPYFYAREGSVVDDENADYFKDNVYRNQKLGRNLQLAAVIICPILAVLCILGLIYVCTDPATSGRKDKQPAQFSSASTLHPATQQSSVVMNRQTSAGDIPAGQDGTEPVQYVSAPAGEQTTAPANMV